jgi:rifampin ADP-ribosylating transferase
MRRIALATGVELAVYEYGDGPPVLLLHAWGETHRIFDRVVPLLFDTLHLIVPDQRGVGESSKPKDGYGLLDAVDDVVALLDAMGIDACWIAGTSSGGYVAQQVAVSHPERVGGLVLIGAPSNLQRRSPDFLVEQLSLFHDPVTRGDIRALNGVLPLHASVPDIYLEDQVTAALTIPRDVWREGLEGLTAAEPPIRRGSITVPTLILWGAEEDVLPADQGEELAAAIEGSHLVTYEGTGHLVLVEQPERVAKDMTAFIAGVPDGMGI